MNQSTNKVTEVHRHLGAIVAEQQAEDVKSVFRIAVRVVSPANCLDVRPQWLALPNAVNTTDSEAELCGEWMTQN